MSRTATIALLVCCMGAAFLVRVWALGHRGVIGFDETYYWELGRNLLGGRGYVLNGLSHTAFPPLYPIMVGLAGFFFREMNYAVWVVSALAGAALPLPVYFLARDIHSQRAGLFAAAAAAVWPSLFFYAAKSVPYAQRMYAGSEPLYVTLLVAGMLFIWLLARKGGWCNAIMAGLFFGLASLARSEGPVVFSFLFLWLIIDQVLTGRLWSKAAVFRTLLVAATIAAVFSPFLIYVHGVTGRWTLGAKLTNNSRVRDTLWDWVQLNKNQAFLNEHYKLNPDSTHMEDPYWGVAPWHVLNMSEKGSIRSGLSLVRHPDLRWVRVFPRVFYEGRWPVVPSWAWILVLGSLFFAPWTRQRLRWWGFCMFNFLPMLLMAVALYVLPRHELPLVALFAVAFGKGLDGAVGLLVRAGRRLFPKRRTIAVAAAAVAVAALLALMLVGGVSLNLEGNKRSPVKTGLVNQRPEKALAAVLKEKLPAGSTLMCMKPWIPARAGLDWRVVPLAPMDRMLKYAAARNIDFALLEDWQVENADHAELLEPYLVEILDYGLPFHLYDFRKAAVREGLPSPPSR